MATRLENISYILKEVYEEQFLSQLRHANRIKAAMQGWKRDRNERIKWVDVQKGKLRECCKGIVRRPR